MRFCSPKRLWLALLLLSVAAGGVRGQWTVIHTFDSPPRMIYFMDDVGEPQVGFAGLQDGEVWRTSDAGTTWVQCQISGGLNSISSFAFENQQTGWLGVYAFGSGNWGLFSTSDSGFTWNDVGLQNDITCLYYNQSSNILVATSEESSFGAAYSKDSGQTWTTIDHDAYPGVEFANFQSGVITNFSGLTKQEYWATHDAGTTWHAALMPNETWQPASLPNSNIYFVVSEYTANFLRSDDGGDTWNLISKLPWGLGSGSGSDGCTRADGFGNLFYQTINNGFWMSSDSGVSWSNIGGPGMSIDSRFVIANCEIYAADTSGSLHVYPLSSGSSSRIVLSSSSPVTLSDSQCVGVPFTLLFHYSSCSYSADSLISATITGSPNFSLLTSQKLPFPMPVGSDDSVTVFYDPTQSPIPSGHDTAQLNLTYDLGSGTMDTSIILIGSLASTLLAQSAQLHREAASAYFGQIDSLTLAVDLSSQINIDSLWPYITEIQATFSWDSSVVSEYGYIQPPGWALKSLSSNGNSESFVIQNKSSVATQPLDLGTALFSPISTQLATGWVELPSLVIDIGSQQLLLCVTDNEDNHWSVKTLGVLSRVAERGTGGTPALQGGEELEIYPNPAEDELFIQNPNEFSLSIEIYDAIGREVLSATGAPASTTTIATQSLQDGVYFFRATGANGFSASRKITIVR